MQAERKLHRPLTGPKSHPYLREMRALEDKVLAAATNGPGVLQRRLTRLTEQYGAPFAATVRWALEVRAENRRRCATCKGTTRVRIADGNPGWVGGRVRTKPCPSCQKDAAA